jgi:hypothetical protein
MRILDGTSGSEFLWAVHRQVGDSEERTPLLHAINIKSADKLGRL